jgi:hypothetical protein
VLGSDLNRKTGYFEVSLGSPPYFLPKSRIFSQLDLGSSRKGMRKRNVYWIYLAQDAYRLEVSCECGNEPSGSIKCGEFID